MLLQRICLGLCVVFSSSLLAIERASGEGSPERPITEIPIRLDQPEVLLSDLCEAQVNLRVDYSGHISGICGLSLSFDNKYVPMDYIWDSIRIGYGGLRRGHTIEVPLHGERYVEWVNVETVSGKSMKDVFTVLGTRFTVSAIPCATLE